MSVEATGEYSHSLVKCSKTKQGRKQNRRAEAEQIYQNQRKQRDYDDALVCCVENMIDDRIMDSGASFHATYCKEELERFKIRFSKTLKDVRYIPGLKKRLISVGQLDEEGMYMVEVPSDGINAAIDGRGNAALWHQMLGHMSEKGFCEPCVSGKQKKVSFVKSGNTRKLQRLELVHTDVYDPTPVVSIGGSRYYVTFIDDSIRKFIEYCANNGIRMLNSVPEIPQQNGVAERMNRTLNERAKSMRLHAVLLKMFRIPEDKWQGKEVSLTHLRVFGYDSYVKVKDVSRDKLDAKSVKCIFIGYGSDEIRYRFWDSKSHKVVQSRDATFNKDSLYAAKAATNSSNLTKPNQKD
ncbi:putative RNA-directed DNA polymerase [Tanacetum coccineum]